MSSPDYDQAYRDLMAADAEIATLRQHDKIGWNGLAKLYEIITGQTCNPAVGLGMATSAVAQLQADMGSREELIGQLHFKLQRTEQQLAASEAAVVTLTREVEAYGVAFGRTASETAEDHAAAIKQIVSEREAAVATLRSEREQYRVQVEERYGAVAQWQNEAETNRQAWLKAQAEVATLRRELSDLILRWRRLGSRPEYQSSTFRLTIEVFRTAANELEAALAAVPAPAAPQEPA